MLRGRFLCDFPCAHDNERSDREKNCMGSRHLVCKKYRSKDHEGILLRTMTESDAVSKNARSIPYYMQEVNIGKRSVMRNERSCLLATQRLVFVVVI
jgi:hypothetical protein